MKLKRLIHNFILKTITGIMLVILILSACLVDSATWIPTILFCISLSWLGLFAFANEFMK